MPDDPSFDLAEALLQVGGDDSVLREIMELFLQDLPKRMAEIRAGLERRDFKLLERAAHTIKGSCAGFGARAAREAAYELERLARAGTQEGAAEVLARLSKETERLALDFTRYLGAPPA